MRKEKGFLDSDAVVITVAGHERSRVQVKNLLED
jgi:hypothetical protein